MKKMIFVFALVSMVSSVHASEFDLEKGAAADVPVPAQAQVLPAVPAPAAAKSQKENWKHVRLTAADGTAITVDYTVQDLAGSVIASPVWINVSGRDFNKVGNVRVLLINYYLTSGPIQLEDTQQLDLKYAGGSRFTGQLQKVLMSEGTYMYGGNIFRQELAVVVDGKWLRDPVSGTNNFKFQLAR